MHECVFSSPQKHSVGCAYRCWFYFSIIQRPLLGALRSFRLKACLELTCGALVNLAQALGFLERQSLLYPVVCHKEISLRERLWLF